MQIRAVQDALKVPVAQKNEILELLNLFLRMCSSFKMGHQSIANDDDPTFDSKDQNIRRFYIAGGLTRCLLTGDQPSDIDIFFYDARVKSAFIEHVLDEIFDGLNVIFQCPKGELTTLSGSWNGHSWKIQLITKKNYPDLATLLESFDFSVCQTGVTFCDGVYSELFLRDAITDIMNKRLVLKNITYPIATVHRVKKYLDKGFRPDDLELFYYDMLERIKTIEFTSENTALYLD